MLVSDIMRTDLRTITTDNRVTEAVAVLVASGLSALPVLDRHGRAVGVCTIRDVLEAEARHQPLERTLVLEIMTPWPATAGPEEDIRAVAQRMLDGKAKRLFVEDRGALVGVVSQTDIVAAVAAARV
jgi:CBS domain-containing protein